MNKHTVAASLVVVGLMFVATPLAAQVAPTGGGVSMASDLYKGAADSLFPPNFVYLQQGMGQGKEAFLVNDTLPIGTGGGRVHYGASDAPLTLSELLQYEATYNVAGDPNRYGHLIQLPVAAGAIALPFNQPGPALNITDTQLCGLFSGQITDWSAVSGSGRVGSIQVVYREEPSGTTEVLTRFLTTVCGTQPGSTLKNGVFSVRSQFKELFVSDTVPANFIHALSPSGTLPEVGDTALYSRVHEAGSIGRIGYSGPDVVADLNDPTRVAMLRGFLPSEVNRQVTIDMPMPPVLSIDAMNPLNWVPVFPNPADGYPLVGFTTLLVGQCYRNPILSAQLRVVLQAHYNLGSVGTNDAAVRAHGLLPISPVWREAIRNHLILQSSINAIGNIASCGSGAAAIGRPL